ncbi:hypothetical protein Tsubulata_049035 [Turnera subulata]|uniref:Pectinesterase inhibitor domain-containing protein n=1 Tax=Turnera subulata TaxID=218843 RepID=A0A9Q0J910_9ROSI|nr:hypothetical protein Tsubulata_049035 [Turnera subulata]
MEAEAGKIEIQDYCKHTKLFALCDRVMTAAAQRKKTADVTSLTQAALFIAKRESTRMEDFFSKLTPRYPQFAEPLKECANFFKESTIFLNLRGMNGGTASLDVHYALDDASQCETALANAKASIPEVTTHIQKWKNLFEIAYSGVMALETAAGY